MLKAGFAAASPAGEVPAAWRLAAFPFHLPLLFASASPAGGAAFSAARKSSGKKTGRGSPLCTPQAGLCFFASEVFCVVKSPAATPSAGERAFFRSFYLLWPGRQKLRPRFKLAAPAAQSAVPKAISSSLTRPPAGWAVTLPGECPLPTPFPFPDWKKQTTKESKENGFPIQKISYTQTMSTAQEATPPSGRLVKPELSGFGNNAKRCLGGNPEPRALLLPPRPKRLESAQQRPLARGRRWNWGLYHTK